MSPPRKSGTDENDESEWSPWSCEGRDVPLHQPEGAAAAAEDAEVPDGVHIEVARHPLNPARRDPLLVRRDAPSCQFTGVAQGVGVAPCVVPPPPGAVP